jgi:hypothetical protein
MTASLPIAVPRRMGRIHSLFSRIHLLEQHAIALHDAFHDQAMRGDATAVIQTLHQAEMWLKAATDDVVVAHVEDLVAGATVRLSSLGRTKYAGLAD